MVSSGTSINMLEVATNALCMWEGQLRARCAGKQTRIHDAVGSTRQSGEQGVEPRLMSSSPRTSSKLHCLQQRYVMVSSNSGRRK